MSNGVTQDEKGKKRFHLVKELAKTLQGRIYLAQDRKEQNQWVIVKETWRELVKQGKSRDGHRVPENFENEREIQLYLSNLPVQNGGFVRCIDNWEDENCYYLAMEYCGGGELFDFIRENHASGEMGELVRNVAKMEQKCQETPNAWSLSVQSIFRQMVETVAWMHSNGVTHLDLSLENTMIASTASDEVVIKIIDFGLAKRFKPDQTFHEKVGKVGYMAPEVYAKKEYSPEKADIWCLGVMLFMMLIGAPPYQFPDPSNPAFRFINEGRLRDVLIHWKRLPLVPVDALDLLVRIFRPESLRISMDELKSHAFVGLSDNTTTATTTTSTATTITTTTTTTATTATTATTISHPNGHSEDTQNGVVTVANTDVSIGTDGSNNTNTDVSKDENNKKLIIKKDTVPWMKTKQAQDMAQQLQQITRVDDMHTFILNMQLMIEHFSNVSKNLSDHHQPHTTPLVDHNSCLHELQLLLQFAKDTLESANDTINKKG